MSLATLFAQLKKQFEIDSPQRVIEKSTFIEGRVAMLKNLNLTEQELTNRVNGYLEYSQQGVFTALAFNKNLDDEIRPKIVEQIANYSFMYGLQTDEVNYSSLNDSGKVQAFYAVNQQPKIAIIRIGNENINSMALPFADIEELQGQIKKCAIDECLKQFLTEKMDPDLLVKNVLKLSITPDAAFNSLLLGVNYNIGKIVEPLKQKFNLETQLDKLLRQDSMPGIIISVINQLDVDGTLESYQKTRLNKKSILPDEAQRKLMEMLDETKLKTPPKDQSQEKSASIAQEAISLTNFENEITTTQKIDLKYLAKEHETVFKKVRIGNHHYWENAEKTVRIHPEKVSVPKVTQDSLLLAIDVAAKNFGNQLTIRGNKEFNEQLLQVLATNDKFANITLTNQDLQQKLDAMRGISQETAITIDVDNSLNDRGR